MPSKLPGVSQEQALSPPQGDKKHRLAAMAVRNSMRKPAPTEPPDSHHSPWPAQS